MPDGEATLRLVAASRTPAAINGLAPLVVESVRRAIDRIRREIGIGGIPVEQNVAVALTVGARAYVLMRGSVVLEGDPIRAEP